MLIKREWFHADIDGGEGLLAISLHHDLRSDVPDRIDVTEFFSDSSDPIQFGTIQRDKGSVIPPHRHLQVRRESNHRNHEVLFVSSGVIKVSLYLHDGSFFSVVTLTEGEAVLLKGGYHSVEFLEPSIIIEVKQGPYYQDKEPMTNGH